MKKEFVGTDGTIGCVSKWSGNDEVGVGAVSYTHLTLPTSDLVQISVVAVSLKKKEPTDRALAEEHNTNTTKDNRCE